MSVEGGRERGSAREEPWRVGVRGGGTISGAQGCPDVEQEVTGPPAGHQQPWKWQVSTEGTEAEAGCGGQHDRGGSSERASAGTGQKPGCGGQHDRGGSSERVSAHTGRKPGCGGQHDQGGSSERVSACTGRKGAQARPGRAGVWRGGVVSTPGGRRTASEPLLCRWLRLPRFPHLQNGTVRIKRVSRQDALYR